MKQISRRYGTAIVLCSALLGACAQTPAERHSIVERRATTGLTCEAGQVVYCERRPGERRCGCAEKARLDRSMSPAATLGF